MSKKILTTVFALALLLTAAPLHPTRATTAARSAQEEMTDEEVREARALALRFIKRLRETDDFAPLVGEFFHEDFAERLRRVLLETPVSGEDGVLSVFDREMLRRADESELRRGYVALMNFWNQQELLGDAALDYANLECGLAGEKRPCGWGRHFRLKREALPAEAVRLAAADPLFEALFGSFLKDETEGGELSPEEQTGRLEALGMYSAAHLRAFIDKLERSVTFLREATAKLRSEAKSLAAAHNATDDYAEMVAAREELKVYHLEGETVGEGDSGAAGLGFPDGTLLIRTRVSPFEMAMARADGRLKIIVVYPDFDGD